MKRTALSLLVIFLYFLAYSNVFALVLFNEIMYDLPGADSGREWIEVYNSSDAPVDISAYRLGEGDTNHKLKLVSGDQVVPAHGYAVIVSDFLKFKNDWPNFAGIAFDSTFSLANDGETLSLKDEKLSAVDNLSYRSASGANNSGLSFGQLAGVWTTTTPTPGKENTPASITPKTINKDITPFAHQSTDKSYRSENSLEKSTSENYEMQVIEIGEGSARDRDVKNINRTTILVLAFFLLCVLVGVGVFLAYKIYFSKNGEIKTGDDFEILEE